ncbi:hypothetical protein JCM10212_006420 [Sporobolomyces blumeae]
MSREKGNQRLALNTPWTVALESGKRFDVVIISIIFVLILAAGAYIARSKNPTLFSSDISETASVAPDESDTATSESTASPAATTRAGTDSSEGELTVSSPAAAATPTTRPVSTTTPLSRSPSKEDPPSSSDSSPAPSPSSTSTSTSGSDPDSDSDDSRPADYASLTLLSGSFVPTASYTVGTGAAATVPTDISNALAKGDERADENALSVEEAKGKIWVGDVSFYAAGKGGTGSCGLALYDGQEPYFAALSMVDWMGSASPSKFCFGCVQLESIRDPSKTTTVMVADSCPARAGVRSGTSTSNKKPSSPSVEPSKTESSPSLGPS